MTAEQTRESVALELEAEGRRLLNLAQQVRGLAAEQPEQASEPSNGGQHLLTAREAAEMLGISTKRLYDLSSRPEGPPYVRLGERSMRWPLLALEEWIHERSRRA